MPGANDAVSGDPLISFHFKIEIGSISGLFLSASGMGSETTTIDHKVVSDMGQDMTYKIPGRLKWGDITLKRGVTDNMDFWNWRDQVRTGNVAAARQDGSIIMYDQEGTEFARWNFERAWPLKVSGPDMGSDDNNIATEEVVIVHEYITRVN